MAGLSIPEKDKRTLFALTPPTYLGDAGNKWPEPSKHPEQLVTLQEIVRLASTYGTMPSHGWHDHFLINSPADSSSPPFLAAIVRHRFLLAKPHSAQSRGHNTRRDTNACITLFARASDSVLFAAAAPIVGVALNGDFMVGADLSLGHFFQRGPRIGLMSDLLVLKLIQKGDKPLLFNSSKQLVRLTTCSSAGAFGEISW